MDNKGRILTIILCLLVIGSGYLAYYFYSEFKKVSTQFESAKKEWDGKEERYIREISSYREREKDYKNKIASIQEQLDKIEREKKELEYKYETASKEKEVLLEKIKELHAKLSAVKKKKIGEGEIFGREKQPEDVFWAKVLREKAMLEAKKADLEKKIEELKEAKKSVEEEKKNLEIELTATQNKISELQRKIEFNERTIQILSEELFKEKEDKKKLVEQIEKFRKDNLNLMRGVKRLESEKDKLENSVVSLEKENAILSKKLERMQKLVKEKTVQLIDFIEGIEKGKQKKKGTQQGVTEEVQLPPIVITPKTESKVLTEKGVEAKIIAVNEENNFVIIDAGEKDGLTAGMRLGVYREGIKIADLEVIETRAEIAACDILQVKPGLELNVGDAVR